MEKSSENNFEQQWKQKFEKTSTPPPLDMWKRIEAGLDEKVERKPLFLLWGIPTYVVSGIAATLILAIGGWFLLTSSEATLVEDIVHLQTNEAENEQNVDQPAGKNAADKEVSGAKDLKTSDKIASTKISAKAAVSANVITSTSENLNKILAESQLNQRQNVRVINSDQLMISVEAGQFSVIGRKLTNSLSKINGLGYEKYPVRYILKRNRLAYVEPLQETVVAEKESRRSWIGVISGLSPFKPNFQSSSLDQLASASVNSYSSNNENFIIQRPSGAQGSVGPGSPGTGDNAFAIPTGSPVQQFTNGRAFNMGIQAGKQLSKRLAIESGIRYIQGNSPVNSNVYTLNQQTGEVNAFVQDYITQNKTLNNAVVGSAETLNNSYEYLSVPVQLAYGIPLLNKLNVEVTGGVSADMFLQNTLQSETTDVASLNASNSAFRALGMSGLGGVRLNYLLDDRWELTVGSAFQQALVSNFESGTAARLRPQMLGINYGVNYHF